MENKDDKKIVKRTRKIKIEEEKPIKRVRKVKKETIKTEDVKKSLEFSLTEVIVIILVTALLVSIVSGVIVFRNYDKISAKKVANNKETSEIIEHYNYIMNNYIGEVDENTLIDAAINGMYGCLSDEYTTYIDKDSTNSLQEQLGGKYTGVGIEITMQESKIVINRVFSDSPAYEAGLKKGDILTKLDEVDLSDKDSLYVSTNIKDNKEKDTFEITYLRDGKEYKTTLTKKLVSIDSVESEEHGSVGYLKISTFSSVTAEQVEDKLNKFSSNIKSIVIDLRDNTGGYLAAAYDISDLFVEKGKNIYQIKDRDEKISSHAASRNVVRKFNKIVVLVNENSASASEVVTLALKESANAIVVGAKTFGKGTVQETKTLKSGAMVKYTSAYWLSPNGNSINKIGITPDIKVEETEKQFDEAIKAAK